MGEELRRTADGSLIIWSPQPKQAAFITCPADDVGFGGARGGGKSDSVPGDWISHEHTYGEHAVGMAFRRERTQLVELIERARQILQPLGYNWHEQDKYFRGPKGGRLRFTYLESDSDADAYQGHSYTRLYPEEMGTHPNEAPINKLMATLRSGQGVPCQMKGTCNPGGPGHQWVKARYKLTGVVKETIRQDFEFENPFTRRKVQKTRIFIPSKVSDNKYLGDDYVANLFQVGSKELVQAWLDGNWDVIQGAYFDCWSEKNIIRPFEVPKEWLRFRSADWGSFSPFSFGWWAVVQDDYAMDDRENKNIILPRGALVRYREWYGSENPSSNAKGLKMTAEQVADGIVEREKSDPKLTYGVLDPSTFKEDGGPSIAERMNTILIAGKCAAFREADNTRVPTIGTKDRRGAMGGWDQMRQRMIGANGRPMLYTFSTCLASIRTIPVLQHDPDRAEDLDTNSEDHAADDWRYACSSRPWLKSKPEPEEPKDAYRPMNDSYGEIEGFKTL